MDELLLVAQRPVDRTYSLHLTRAGSAELPIGQLHVRGSERFALELENERGRRLVAGFDGQRAWIVPPMRPLPVLVARDPERLHEWLEGNAVEMPFLSLTRALERLKRYELELSEEGEHLRLRGTPPAERWSLRRPRVELRADRASQRIEEVRLSWPTPEGDDRVLRIAYESEQPRDDSLYAHRTHHGPARRVVLRN